MPSQNEFLFGQDLSAIKKTCVLMPFFSKDILSAFGIKSLSKGSPFSSANTEHFTFIHTRMGAAFTGDAVLSLQDSPCQTLILLGACGAVRKTDEIYPGALVLPEQALALESFSQLLREDLPSSPAAQADIGLLKRFQETAEAKEIPLARCASVGSIFLEEKYKDYFIKEGIDVLDLECAAFFNAAGHIGRHAIALFYVTDVLGQDSPYSPASSDHCPLIKKSIHQAASLIPTFTKTL